MSADTTLLLDSYLKQLKLPTMAKVGARGRRRQP